MPTIYFNRVAPSSISNEEAIALESVLDVAAASLDLYHSRHEISCHEVINQSWIGPVMEKVAEIYNLDGKHPADGKDVMSIEQEDLDDLKRLQKILQRCIRSAGKSLDIKSSDAAELKSFAGILKDYEPNDTGLTFGVFTRDKEAFYEIIYGLLKATRRGDEISYSE